MAACRLSFLSKKSRYYLIHCCHNYSSSVTSNVSSKEIIIPYRIERGPTDILKQLSSTVHKDYTAPHYKYEDDPYFIPSSNVTKRAFALSKESGRKAARYFLEKYPDLFKCNTSVPHIKAFDPPVVYTEENVTSIKHLKECICNDDIDNSLHVYKILKGKGIAVSQAVKQELLELLCFYNCIHPRLDDLSEERFFARTDVRDEKWNTKGMAETLFEEMDKDNLAYSTMIAGSAKFLNADRAEALFHEMLEKGFPGTVIAYNNFICVVNLLKETHEMRWEYVLNILGIMNKEGISPNLYTMNNALEILERSSKWKKAPDISLNVMAEMKRLQIVPSLGTYSSLLKIFCGRDYSKAHILYQIMAEVENKEFEIRCPSDVSFFVTAMEACFQGLRDKDLAYRVHNLLEHKKNSRLLGCAFSESLYFKNFFKLLCATEDIDKLMETYEKYVPNTYTPEPSVTFAVIESIYFSGNYQHLPKMCSDVLFFEQTERENILSLLTEAAGSMKHDSKIQKDLVQMLWNIYEKINFRSQGRRQLTFEWTATQLENILKTFMHGDDFEKSWSVVEKLKNEENSIIGFPQKSILLRFCECCLQKDEYEKFLFCVSYAMRGNYPEFRGDAEELAKNMIQEGKLTEKQNAAVTAMFLSTSDTLDASSTDSSSSSSDESSNEDSSSEESASDEESEKDSTK